MEKIFKPSLDGAAVVLKNQLNLAKENNQPVDRVVLVGAFGKSPALKKRIRNMLLEHPGGKGREIHLITPSDPSVFPAPRNAID